jgi:sulfur relay (sulfurtransferase) DsrC/TusE family protein
MSTMRIIAPAFLGMLLSNCGTYVPDIQEPPFGQAAQQELVQAIVTSVHCEVVNAIVDFYDDARKYPALRPIAKNMST